MQNSIDNSKKILEIFACWGPVRMRLDPERMTVRNLTTNEEISVGKEAWEGIQSALDWEDDQHFLVTPEVRRG